MAHSHDGMAVAASEVRRMTMKNSMMLFAVSLIAGSLSACAYHAPYQTSGPTVAKEGVRVALAGDRCYVNRTAEQFPTNVDDNRLHVDVELAVTNDSKEVATVALDQFQLADAKTKASVAPLGSGQVSLAPNETKVVALAFEENVADGDCHHELALAPQGAISVEHQPIDLASIRFQPAR
jgi:hypothetical protein